VTEQSYGMLPPYPGEQWQELLERLPSQEEDRFHALERRVQALEDANEHSTEIMDKWARRLVSGFQMVVNEWPASAKPRSLVAFLRRLTQ